MPPLTPDQRRNIQRVGLAGFRKDFQQLLFLRFAYAASARKPLATLKDHVASYLEVRGRRSDRLGRNARSGTVASSGVAARHQPARRSE